MFISFSGTDLGDVSIFSYLYLQVAVTAHNIVERTGDMAHRGDLKNLW